MKAEVKQKWLGALRGGEFRQAQQALKKWGRDTKPSYCCLGVLCEVARPLGGAFDGTCYTFANPAYVPLILEEEDCGDEAESEVIGLDTELNSDCLLDLGLSGGDQITLMHMNDDDGANFEQIASWIEENIKETP